MIESVPTDQLLARLSEDASYFRPELFAIYGVDRAGRPFLGWGMQLGEDSAIFYQPRSETMHVSASADQVLRVYLRFGDAKLRWLDD